MRKILVLCDTNASKSQMAEAYLRIFTHGNAEIFSAGISPQPVHPLAFMVMLDDNIDIAFAQSKPIDYYVGQHFDYLITVCGDEVLPLSANITADHRSVFKISDPEAKLYANENEELTAFLDTREEIKREMLRFIGRRDELRLSTVKSLEY
jgi:arsenate reductase